MNKLLILPAIFFCLSFSTIYKKAEIKSFAPSAGTFLFIPGFGANPGTTSAGTVTGHLNEVPIDIIVENQFATASFISGINVISSADISDFVFTKNFDRSSLRLKRMIYGGQIIPTLEIRIYDGVALNPVYKIAYTNAYILKINNNIQPCSGANCTGISEEISFNTVGIITWTNSITTPPQIISYNVQNNSVSFSGL